VKLKFALIAIGCLFFASASAQNDISKDFGDYRVYYSIFNSSFITPEVADLYGLTRGANRALVNISLVKVSDEGNSLGLPAQVTGQAQNLLMQSIPLRFIEIDEGDATYYLASFTFEDQDPLHFTINVGHDGVRVPYEVKLTRTLYRD
jgi:hypothetical protein